MKAAFAGCVFELVGCDTMHNADKFARFSSTDTKVDCHVTVTIQKEYLIPQGDPVIQAGYWRGYQNGNFKQFYHRHANLMIETSDDFSQIHLFFCKEMPMLETVLYLQVQQAICSFLLLRGAGLIHSAGLSVDGKGVLLCGRSGVGKSTMARRLREIGTEFTLLSEDMPALVREKEQMMVCGTPLCGDDEYCENGKAPLTQIVFLCQAKENRFVKPSLDKAVYELLTVLPRVVYEDTVATAAVDLSVLLTKTTPVVIFENDGTKEAAQLLLDYIHNEQREPI